MKLLGVVLVCRNQGYRALPGEKPAGRTYMSANRTCETALLLCRPPEPGMAWLSNVAFFFVQTHRSMEMKMRTRISAILGVLLVAVPTSQIETAEARSVRKAARAPYPATQQLRDGAGSRPERYGTPAATAGQSKSCDVVWCY